MSLWIDPHSRREDQTILRHLLREGDTYIDVGANIGHLLVEAGLAVGPVGHVYAFEPHPRICQYLLENCKLNDLNNVSVAQSAVSDSNRWVSFSDSNTDDQNKVLTETSKDRAINTIAVRLEPYINEQQSVRVLKIDVEGYEIYALKGCGTALTRVEFLLFEVWDGHLKRNDVEYKDIHNLLDEMGFLIFQLDMVSKRALAVQRNQYFPEITNLVACRNEQELHRALFS
jgi:FkbM family methyltransferase